MDIPTALIGVAVFIISAGVLLFISMFGMKEKSYEEALAEQRKQTNALLGTHNRNKPKEKKVKKANKKVKEKHSATVTSENETAEESEDTESPGSSASSSVTPPHQKLHVEFKEATILPEVPPTEAINTSNKQKRGGKKEKMRPILIHKQGETPTVITDPVDVPPANHFEQLHPKDEFELLHLHSKEDAELAKDTNPPKEKSNKPKQNGVPEPVKDKAQKVRQNSLENKTTKQPTEIPKEKTSNKEKQQQQQQQQNNNSSLETQKPKKPSKQVVPQQPAVVIAEKEESPVNVAAATTATAAPQTNGVVTINAPKDKKKKKGEANTLQQIAGTKDGDINMPLLLNVVRKAELSRSEVQILIDLLLNKQHEAPEILDEWSEGKADPIQKLKRQLAEKEKALIEEQETLAGAQAKLREIRAEQNAEKSQLQQRVRGLEEALQAKHLELQAANTRLNTQNQKMQQIQTQLNDEGMALRKLREETAALQMQRQQIDIHISQAQEAEATIQDLQGRNNQLTMELHSLTEQSLAAKEHQQGLIAQLNHYKTELDEKEAINRQFEELRRDLEHRLNLAHRQENELKVELSQLNSICKQNAEEIRRLEHGEGLAAEEVRNLKKQKEELDHALNQLSLELRDLQAEKSEMQVLKANGVTQENQVHKEELLNLHNELSSVKSELQSTKTELVSLERKHATELDTSNSSLNKLQHELEEQRTKNNELRKKNWKVMDALKAAENRTATKQSSVNLDETINRIRLEEQELNRKFIQRLFPDIKTTDNNITYDKWLENVEKAIQKHNISPMEKSKEQENTTSSSSSPEVNKLQGQVQHYKSIIEHTEGILKKLQNHIEQEEINWRKELKIKELEIEALKQKYSLELQTKVEQLETKLNTEQDARQKVTEAYDLLKNNKSSYSNPAVIEKLSEEVNRLNEQLNLEQKKNSELARCPSGENEMTNACGKMQNSSTNGPSLQEAKTK